jgi:hypothetical protein
LISGTDGFSAGISQVVLNEALSNEITIENHVILDQQQDNYDESILKLANQKPQIVVLLVSFDFVWKHE